MVKIMAKKTGNCPCRNCGKVQDGLKLHPFTVWYKNETEKRGHNAPVCSTECAKELSNKIGA